MTQSSGRSSQRSLNGARYFAVVQRRLFTVKPKIAEPLGHRWPCEMGLSGLPSTSSSLPSLETYASVPHPTAQYGQTLGTALACFTREVSSCVRFDGTFGSAPTRRS